jgi:3-isopropylmalate/(R)-2-methylmalate dehydratase small subunit
MPFTGKPFERLEAVAAPWMQPNVDTDLIIRVERCAQVPRAELGRYALETVRLRPDGSPDPDFVLNRPPFDRAGILVAGENFGCGSSREMAVWALAGLGIRCVIAPSFGEIFFGNCFQNGVLPIRLPADQVAALAAGLLADPTRAAWVIDLPAQTIRTGSGETLAFEVEPLRRSMLIEGLDEIAATLRRASSIEAWQQADRRRRPWAWPEPG